jgi:hypothetical protein
VNVFAGLLKNARDGYSYNIATQTASKGRGQKRRILMNQSAKEGRGQCWSFPFDTFESAILSKLREIDPHDILNGDEGPDESLTLANRLSEVESSIAAIEVELDEHGESQTLFKRLRVKESERRDLAARLTEAQQKAANPLSASWGECQSLLEAVCNAPGQRDAKLRLRSVLRRIVDSTWLLVVPRGRDRLCAVQVWFADGCRCRNYLILCRPAKGTHRKLTPGGWWARSLATVAAPGDLDLRRREDAAALERLLAEADLTDLAGTL